MVDNKGNVVLHGVMPDGCKSSHTLSQCGDFFTAPVGVAHRALPVGCSHTHAAPAADPVAAAAAN